MDKIDKELAFFKLLAVVTAAIYLYKAYAKNGGTLNGNPYGIRLNPEKLADLASRFAPPQYQHHARNIGQAVLERYL